MQDNINNNSALSDKKPTQISNLQPPFASKNLEESLRSPNIGPVPLEAANKHIHVNNNLGNSPSKNSPQKILAVQIFTFTLNK